MTVYHGSNVEVKEPEILKPNRELDFGNGFYTTTNLDQAGEIDREETFKRLKVKTLYNQLVFSSPLALSFIRFRESEVHDA